MGRAQDAQQRELRLRRRLCDGGAERIAKSYPEIHLLALPENLSFAWAANQGAALAETEFLLQLNPDTELGPGVLRALVDFLVDTPSAAGAVPTLEDPDGRSQHRWQLRRLPEARHLAFGRPGPAAFRSVPSERSAPVPQPAASAWLVACEPPATDATPETAPPAAAPATPQASSTSRDCPP